MIGNKKRIIFRSPMKDTTGRISQVGDIIGRIYPLGRIIVMSRRSAAM